MGGNRGFEVVNDILQSRVTFTSLFTIISYRAFTSAIDCPSAVDLVSHRGASPLTDIVHARDDQPIPGAPSVGVAAAHQGGSSEEAIVKTSPSQRRDLRACDRW